MEYASKSNGFSVGGGILTLDYIKSALSRTESGVIVWA